MREPKAEELANDLAQLREFLIAAIQHEHDLMTAALANEIEGRRESERMIEKARAIQANEYERRLDELNHAHAKANEDKQAFLLKVTYEAFVKEFDTWKLGIVSGIAAEGAKATASARLWAIGTSLAVVIVGALMVAYFKA